MNAYGNFGTYGGIAKDDEITLDLYHPEHWNLMFPKSHFILPLKASFSASRKTGLDRYRTISDNVDASYPRKVTADITLWPAESSVQVWIVSQTSEQMNGIVVMNCTAHK